LIKSYEHNDIDSVRTIKENMMQTYGNSSIANPLMDISRIIDLQKSKTNMNIINLNLDEALAISDERFEDAARIRDKIKKLGARY
jgi:protein-arginine kinase activator protein McsA